MSSQHDDGWRLSDALWARMAPLIPPPKPHPLGCHRPRIPDRVAMDAILLVLRTGMQWGALDATGLCSHESPRVLRRLLPLREWSNEQAKQVFAGSPGTCGTTGAGASRRVSIAMGCRGFDRTEDRLCAADLTRMVQSERVVHGQRERSSAGALIVIRVGA